MYNPKICAGSVQSNNRQQQQASFECRFYIDLLQFDLVFFSVHAQVVSCAVSLSASSLLLIRTSPLVLY
jgi:hypothetical protein